MADQSLIKNFNFELAQDFQGYVSSVDPSKVGPNVMVQGSQNMYKKLSGTLAVRPGLKLRGAINAINSPISSEFVWNTSWGDTRILIVSEGELQVEYNDVYYVLMTLTKTRLVFDKWWYDTEKKDRCIFVMGDSNLYDWSGGIAVVGSSTSNTLTLNDPTTTWEQQGFSSEAGHMTIIINGNTYTYTGGQDTDTLTGVSGDPTGEAIGSVVLQAVVTVSNSPEAGFLNDFIKVVQNQLYVGSYTSRLLWISANDDYTNYVIPTPDIPGSPDYYPFDSNLNGIGIKSDPSNPGISYAYISYGTSEWAEISFPTHTDSSGVLVQQITINTFPVATGCAAFAHEFIDSSGDSIVYLSQDKQVRTLGNFNLLFVTGYPSLSQEIATELSQEDFTGGALRCIEDFTYLTCPTSGKVFLYQVRQSINSKAGEVGSVQFGNNQLVTERLWHAPMIWNATRIDSIDGIVHAFSNANPQVYQVWDTNQWHDDSPSGQPLPYSCILQFGYRNLSGLKGGSRARLLKFDKNYTEGYIAAGTNLNLIMNYEYEGSKNVLTAPINNPTRPAYTFGGSNPTVSATGSLGDDTLGDSWLGEGGIEESIITDLSKFRCINYFSLLNNNIFEYQPIYQSDEADAQWEILATGTNMIPAEIDPNFIINKS